MAGFVSSWRGTPVRSRGSATCAHGRERGRFVCFHGANFGNGDGRNALMKLKYRKTACVGERSVQPVHVDTVIQEANAAIRNRELGKAEDILSSALVNDIHQPKLFLRLVLLEQKRNDPDLSRRFFEVALSHNPEDAATLQAWGLFESKQGNRLRASRLLLRSVGFEPRNVTVLRWRPLMCVTELYRIAVQTSNPTIARRRYRACLLQTPDYVPAYISLSMLEIRTSKNAEAARAVILQGLRLSPSEKRLMTIWGLVEAVFGSEFVASRLFQARDRRMRQRRLSHA
uniref:Uncharacterized protein n=1 Tax=Rhodosorus marinus TaxID=101924 RepID=A0A7S3A5Z8_9RHOD|mmetsp:Transcript_43944/g.171680  ORF Transcript_43944/g.171680 Transcript_43944/m.171680 type:complete len:286 (+) Transcript_43944:107-964(+)